MTAPRNLEKLRSCRLLKGYVRAVCTGIFIVILTMLAFPATPAGLTGNTPSLSHSSKGNEAASLSEPQVDPIGKVTFVATNSSSLIDEFSFMAAVPTAVFRYGGHQYLSPVVFDTQSDSEKWLIQDWAQYLSADGGVRQGVSVGSIPDSTLFNLQKLIGAQIYPRVKGATSADIASLLALMDWRTSGVAVFALSDDSLAPLTVSQSNVNHTFINDPVTDYTPSVSVSSSDPVYVSFTPPVGCGWIEGSFNWTGSEFFTHILIDPGNVTVDYSSHAQAYGERFFTQSPVPLYFWVPKTADGQWQFVLHPETAISRTVPLDCQIKYHSGFSQTISVPSNARWLNVSANWNKLGSNLNLALVDPTGRLGQWAPSGTILSSPGLKSIALPYPMSGVWTAVIAWMDSTSQENDVNLSWRVSALPVHLQAYLESAGNGAVLASLLNAPLLFVSENSVPYATMSAAAALGVSTAYLVDPDNIHSLSVLNELESFANVTNLDSAPLVSTAIRQHSAVNDVVVTLPSGSGDETFASAALSAAVHGCPVFSLCGDDNALTTRAEETWAPYLIGPDIEVYITSRYTTRTENGWYDERIPNKYSMTASALGFKGFLEDRGAYNATQAQQIVVISSLDNLKPSFDRSLQCNFSVGRIPTDDAAIASVMLSAAALHRFLFSIAQSVNQALLSMYAYTNGAGYVDNFHSVHEIWQIENSTSALQSAGFGIERHVGYSEVFAALAAQPSFWSLSTHGTLTSYPTDPPERPNGLGLFSMRNEDAPYGFEVSVTQRESTTHSDHLVNPVAFSPESLYHVIKSTNDLEAAIGDIGSPIVILTACLLGGSGLPEMLMEHGAVAVIASPRTVYFQPAGLLSVLITISLAAGNTTGSSLAEALRAISYDYSNPPLVDPTDYANQQILFGDPSIVLYNTATNPHVTAIDPGITSFGGHLPGRGVPAVAGLGSSVYLPESLNNLGIDNNFYSTNNYSTFLWLLPLRHAVLLEPGSLSILSSNMSASASLLDGYVHSGGTLVLFGVSGDTSWMPWSVVVEDTAPASPMTVTDPSHPLMSLPNVVGSSTGYRGYFSVVSANLSVIATDGSHPVVVAGVVGTGKLALTTTYPMGTEGNATIQNAALWYERPSLYLSSVTMNEYVIWAGDRVVVTVHVTDIIGRGIGNASVRVWLNSSQVDVLYTGDGAYVATLSEQWTGNRSGYYDLRIESSKLGYDTMSRLLNRFLYIHPSPWLAIGIVGAVVAAVFVGWLYIRHRRGGRLLPSRHRGRSSQNQERERREKERQKKEDQKVNPSDFFGV
jgi:hypothetical protein